MRFLALFFATIVLAANPSKADWVTTIMPSGGITLVAPGYSFKTPGAGWMIETPQALQDGVPASSSTGTWRFHNSGAGNLIIGNFEWPYDWRGTPADLPAVVDFPAYDFQSMSTKGAVASNSMVHGAVCSGKRYASSEGRVVYHRICSHPDYPSFGLSLRFVVGPGPDTAAVERELMAVLDSLTFTPLDFRVRELRTSLLTHMTFAEGAFWALNWDNGSGKLVRIDPKTNAIAAAIPVNSLPGNLEVSAGAIWVSGGTSVRRIDPKTNTITGTYPAGELGARLLPDDRGVWVEWTSMSSGWFLPRHMTARGYALLDAASGKSGRKIEMPVTNKSIQTPNGIFYISRYHIQQFDGGRVTERMAVAPDTEVMRYDGRYLWLGGGWSGNGYSILRYDPQVPDLPPVPVRPTPAPARDFVEWNGLFCILMQHAVQCLADDGRVAKQFPLQGELMAGLTVQDGSLWVMPSVGHALIRLDEK
jgi:hypothetical protein